MYNQRKLVGGFCKTCRHTQLAPASLHCSYSFSPVVLACKACPLHIVDSWLHIVDSWLCDHPCPGEALRLNSIARMWQPPSCFNMTLAWESLRLEQDQWAQQHITHCCCLCPFQGFRIMSKVNASISSQGVSFTTML